jgi:DnaD/phage-associated family protein
MARKRFVTSEISADRKIAKLAEKNPVAAALWPWFITSFDDWGRMNADPIEVKLTIFPAFPYTSDEVEEFIKLYHEFEIAYFYEVDGKSYLAVNPDTWLKYQTYIRKDKLEKQKSKIPEPKNAPWIAKNKTSDNLATKIVAKQQSATINVLSPSPSPSPISIEREIDARARDNISPENKSQESNQEKPYDDEIAKINSKSFEFGMNGVTPEFREDAEMRLSEGTDPELIIKALSIAATNANGNAGAKCRYAIKILQGWAAEGIKTLEQWTQKVTPRARDKPNMPDKTAAKLDKYEKAKLEARRMLKEQGVVFDDEDTS